MHAEHCTLGREQVMKGTLRFGELLLLRETPPSATDVVERLVMKQARRISESLQSRDEEVRAHMSNRGLAKGEDFRTATIEAFRELPSYSLGVL